ncbi:hypothetical protein [Croceitalea dokdonensis]|nr:hypothetical protein [Croceitalea dokdonensis]
MKKGFISILALFYFVNIPVFAQNDAIIEAFGTYTELPREVVSVHLNKTIFFKEEEIGFQAYVFEKGTKLLSQETRNLYCMLVNEENQVVKQKMVLINDGFGHGSFAVDSSMVQGKYKFKAFTNWMRNFSENNGYSQEIVVVDVNKPEIVEKSKGVKVDAQFLPEGGHALAGVDNTFGVIIKDQNGLGVKNLKGIITTDEGHQASSFELDQFGIGRFILIPKHNVNYYAEFEIGEQRFKRSIGTINKAGINLQLTDLKNEVGIVLNSVGSKQKKYQMALHNGLDIKMIDIDFSSNPKQIKVLKKEDLFDGLNIITVFDKNGNPLLERLYFNFQDVERFRLGNDYSITHANDSIQVKLHLGKLTTSALTRLSVSVLPKETLAYASSQNILSQLHLNPYLRGHVQDAPYYFTETTRKKQFQLDNLLITQGWSSYDWHTITTKPPQYLFDFEKGITLIGQVNKKEDTEILLSPLENNSFESFSVSAKEPEFTQDQLYPYQDELLRFSEVRGEAVAKSVPLYARFKPSSIPILRFNGKTNGKINNQFLVTNATDIYEGFKGFEKITELDEVMVQKNPRKERVKRLKDKSMGQVIAFEEDDYRRRMFLGDYLSQFGFYVSEADGRFNIATINPNSPNNNQPLIYLDNILLSSYNVLARWRMDVIDYIEINRSGLGGGILGGGGIIKIFTDPQLAYKTSKKAPMFNEVAIPLAFSRPKRFYTPKFNSYQDAVFKSLGAIDWHPNLSTDGQGNVSFKIPNLGLDQAQMFIEGVVNGNQLVSEMKIVDF